jgi:hypothetical protein
MLTQVVQAALQVCDKTEYSHGGKCRSCSGTLSGYDTRKKRFVLLSDAGGDKPVEVILHRAYCRECGRIWKPEEPFYQGTRIGSPVVDLCQTFSASLSIGHVATLLEKMGVKVDRWSVRSYCTLPIPRPPTIAAFGMYLPVCIISLSGLAAGKHESEVICGEDVLAACNYPSRPGYQ